MTEKPARTRSNGEPISIYKKPAVIENFDKDKVELETSLLKQGKEIPPPERLKIVDTGEFTGPQKTYRDHLKSPKWQRVRLKVFERDNWKCVSCGDEDSQLSVHHQEYAKSGLPWEAPLDKLITVCDRCHADMEDWKKECGSKDFSLKTFRVPYNNIPSGHELRLLKFSNDDKIFFVIQVVADKTDCYGFGVTKQEGESIVKWIQENG